MFIFATAHFLRLVVMLQSFPLAIIYNCQGLTKERGRDREGHYPLPPSLGLANANLLSSQVYT